MVQATSRLDDRQTQRQRHTILSEVVVGADPVAMIKPNEKVMKVQEILDEEPPRLLILFDKGQEQITRTAAEILGHTCRFVDRPEDARRWSGEAVIGVENSWIAESNGLGELDRILINTHCIHTQDARVECLGSFCDYEYLYSENDATTREDLTRFLGFVLGQVTPHYDLMRKQRSTLLSTTFADIRDALPNLDILSVGADSVELRVDLLRDPAMNSQYESVPSLKYVGEQLMLLRRRTSLPIIFTTRCTNENGRFPMDDPTLFYKYLRKAIQWGCEYIDVELWLPETIRSKLAAEKGNSKIISAWHDYSGTFKWTSTHAQQLFKEGAVYGDIVKMIAFINTMDDNYELEYFRSMVQSSQANPPLSGLNMSSIGQMSRTLNKVFTPITHPLLPVIAAPGQLSAAEINSMLHSMGQKPQLDIYAIGHSRSNGMFFEKCLNELSLPHRLMSVEQATHASIASCMSKAQFGGAYLDPPQTVDSAPYLPTLTEAASTIGQVDTIVVRTSPNGQTLLAENVTWKAIRSTLTQDFTPSAFAGRTALVLATNEAQAAATLFALASLNMTAIDTIGFDAKGLAGTRTRQVQSLHELRRDDGEQPFVIISALPAEKSFMAIPILKHYSTADVRKPHPTGMIFIDLSNGHQERKADPVLYATSLGWTSYPAIEVRMRIFAETYSTLCGENVPLDFVRLAGGQGLFT